MMTRAVFLSQGHSEPEFAGTLYAIKPERLEASEYIVLFAVLIIQWLQTKRF